MFGYFEETLNSLWNKTLRFAILQNIFPQLYNVHSYIWCLHPCTCMDACIWKCVLWYQCFKPVASNLLDLESPLSGAYTSATIKSCYINTIYDTQGYSSFSKQGNSESIAYQSKLKCYCKQLKSNCRSWTKNCKTY